jgi:Ribosomal RNA adenine dimethylase
MNNFIYNLYRLFVPKPIRTKLLKKRLGIQIMNYLKSLPSNELDSEKKAVLDYVEKNGVSIFPYEFTKKYSPASIKVYSDVDNKMKYVIQNDKRIYFKKKWSVSRIKRSYNQLLMEQDDDSPHKYLSEDFNISESDIVADFGAAEGNFSLSIVDKVKHLYLFETDKEWIKALKETFKPWKHKVTIVRKFVSNFDNEKHCKGDSYFKNKQVSFLKIDVDGAEEELLAGIETILENSKPIKLALCTYHKNDDEVKFTKKLKQFGFNIKTSKGFMIFYYDKKIKSPFIRRGLIRAWK